MSYAVNVGSYDNNNFTNYSYSPASEFQSCLFFNISVNDTVNCSLNATEGPQDNRPPPYALWQTIIIAFFLSVITIGTTIGNVLVCTAVAIVRRLRTPSNLLIVSLAVSDLLVSILDMPFAIILEIKKGEWVLGQLLCDAWTSLDVMLCTASILNLCVISVDRYFVITRPFQYAMKRTPRRMALMVTGAWLSAALISIPPLFGWKSEKREGECNVSQEIGYQFYATIGAFYLPLSVMIVVYYRIFLVSYRIAHAEARAHGSSGAHDHAAHNHHANSSHRPSIATRDSDREENHNYPNGSAKPKRLHAGKSSDASVDVLQPTERKGSRFHLKFWRRNRMKLSNSTENKATKTLGVIMGAFTACWLPFFIVALIKPFCHDSNTCIPQWLNSTFLWLGYTNSFLNPLIYARFNRDFRRPFKEILCFRCIGINDRLRSLEYRENYGGPAPVSLRDTIRPPVDTVVRYHNQAQTIVKVGNGDAVTAESKL